MQGSCFPIHCHSPHQPPLCRPHHPQSNYRVDLRDTAAFVRDRAARVNCAVLPFSCKVDVDMKVRGGCGWVGSWAAHCGYLSWL